MSKKTLFDKIWDAHVVSTIQGGPTQLYIDRHYCHEVTSPQAFNGLRERGLKVFRPDRTTCSPDHNIPTLNQDKPIADPISRNQVEALSRNAKEFGITLYLLGHEKNGIIHSRSFRSYCIRNRDKRSRDGPGDTMYSTT